MEISKGFSTVESLVALALIGIIASGTFAANHHCTKILFQIKKEWIANLAEFPQACTPKASLPWGTIFQCNYRGTHVSILSE